MPAWREASATPCYPFESRFGSSGYFRRVRDHLYGPRLDVRTDRRLALEQVDRAVVSRGWITSSDCCGSLPAQRAQRDVRPHLIRCKAFRQEDFRVIICTPADQWTFHGCPIVVGDISRPRRRPARRWANRITASVYVLRCNRAADISLRIVGLRRNPPSSPPELPSSHNAMVCGTPMILPSLAGVSAARGSKLSISRPISAPVPLRCALHHRLG